MTGSLPCDVVLHGNYDNPGIAVELINVRRLGGHQGRIATEPFSHAVDDLARYILGVDENFEKAPRR